MGVCRIYDFFRNLETLNAKTLGDEGGFGAI